MYTIKKTIQYKKKHGTTKINYHDLNCKAWQVKKNYNHYVFTFYLEATVSGKVTISLASLSVHLKARASQKSHQLEALCIFTPSSLNI